MIENSIRLKDKYKTHYREFVSNLEPLYDEVHFNDATEGNYQKIVGFSSTAYPAKLNCVNKTLLTEWF